MGRRSRRARHEAPVSFFAFQDIITAVTGILILVTLVMSLDLIKPKTAADARSAEAAEPGTSPAELADARRQLAEVRATAAALATALAVPKPAGDPSGLAVALSAAQAAADASSAHAQSEIAAAGDARAGLDAANAQAVQIAKDTVAANGDALAAAVARRGAGDTRLLLPGNGAGKMPVLVEARADGIVIGRLDSDGSPHETGRAAPADVESRLATLIAGLRVDRQYVVVYVRPDGVDLGQRVIRRLQESTVDVGWDALGIHKLFGDTPPAP